MEKSNNINPEKGSFYGEVIDKTTGAPVDSAEVQLHILIDRKNDFVTITKYTDSTGHYEFKDIDPLLHGHYNLDIKYKHKILVMYKGLNALPNTIIFNHAEIPPELYK